MQHVDWQNLEARRRQGNYFKFEIKGISWLPIKHKPQNNHQNSLIPRKIPAPIFSFLSPEKLIDDFSINSRRRLLSIGSPL